MRFLSKLLKYILRFVSSVIIFLLVVGWAKMNRNLGEYIDFLNTNDRSVFHRSQPATRADPFWPETRNTDTTGDIADMLSEDPLDAELSGMDVYDPAFEDELNALPESSFTGEDEGFGFTTDAKDSDTQEPVSKSELLNLIKEKERELTQ